MFDFYEILAEETKKGVEIYPAFQMVKSKDLMIRGGDFYAVWLEDEKRWSTDEQDVIDRIDRDLYAFAKEYRKAHEEEAVYVRRMKYAKTGLINEWHAYCQKQLRENFHQLDERIIFAGTELTKEDYATRTLDYELGPGDITAYERLMSTLYFPEERKKIEWAIGSIVCGDSKDIQKFLVLYGAGGTGKSTVLHIIEQLFKGYTTTFEAKELGSSSNNFSLEPFRSNPLVAIQHDGNLSRIEDNTRINSLVSHEDMLMNVKFKSAYPMRFNAMLFMGTNKPVQITDARSGIIRRLIDVSPSGRKLPNAEYKEVMKQIGFELGAIAQHCLDVYLAEPSAYDNYIPEVMLTATNDFYDFVLHNYPAFKKDNGVQLQEAYTLFKAYCEDAKIPHVMPRRIFEEELKAYFDNFYERYVLEDGTRVRSYYVGFKKDRFNVDEGEKAAPENGAKKSWLELKPQRSFFDDMCSGMPAQLATETGKPAMAWKNVTTKLRDIPTNELHYVNLPESHIVIDFDIPKPEGGKDLERNIQEASQFPPTYAEVSKSGGGVHLHYFYTGDVSTLSPIYKDHVEVKVFTGDQSLRRKLTVCNNVPIRTISSGLPIRGDTHVKNFDGIKDDLHLHAFIAKGLRKGFENVPPNTKPCMELMAKGVEEAYKGGLSYDISDMKEAIRDFALGSTNNAQYCLKLASQLHYKSKDREIEGIEKDSSIEETDPETETIEDTFIFFDVEVFPNLFLVEWKVRGEGKPVVRMFNPSSGDIAKLLTMNLVGFNNREYDNHMLYGCLLGETPEQLYQRSIRIINSGKKFPESVSRAAKFGKAYNLSYTDIYDFAAEKISLKKWEIRLGIHHKELGLDWNEPVPEELWETVAEYCENDVLATEAVFNHLSGDWTARKILAELTGMTPNTRTNALSAKLIFGDEEHPQSEFNYRNMGDLSNGANPFRFTEDLEVYQGYEDEYTLFDNDGRPVFKGYEHHVEDILNKKGVPTGKRHVSTYRGEEVGEGGEVFATPGIHEWVALLDIASMHPTTVEQEKLFGKYTKNFSEIKQTRIDIKHKDFESAKKRFGGRLAKYLDNPDIAKTLSYALKIVINAVYGCTAASFENPFRDPRNEDNIVAKRGALFMINLRHAVESKGFIVAHIKTDSIKIPNATKEIIDFVTFYGKMYGYNFEHEATYERMCLVNDAVYIARFATVDQCYSLYGKEYVDSAKDICSENKSDGGQWTATGAQFAIPYVFKSCFSKEDITFDDFCETKNVSSALYLDMNEGLGEDEHSYRFVGKVGQFTPVKEGCGGGLLMRLAGEENGVKKFANAGGTTGYRWLESELIRELGKEDCVDRSYYDNLVADAKEAISKYGDYDWFVDVA